ncbi:MAG: Rpn family recombination-promoting nuclease/putative transposase [Haliscomenobacter sp.]
MTLPDKYINPFTDFGFKKLFGSEPNKDLLIDFLNEVLPAKHRIKELSYSPNEQLGNTDIDRKAIFDIYCTGENGERFIVEMQKAKQNYFKDRSVYYSSFPIQEQGWKGGGWSFRLAAVYLIGILDFVFSEDEESQEVRHEIQLRDTHCRVFYEKLTYIYLEMPNFHKTETELETNFDKWMYVLQQLPNLQKRPRALQERVFQKLFDAAEIAKFTPADRSHYESSLKYYRDLKNVIDTSYAEGIAEGLEKGLEKGREVGIIEGVSKGKAEIARQMKLEGDSVDKISRLTGLSGEEIEKL